MNFFFFFSFCYLFSPYLSPILQKRIFFYKIHVDGDSSYSFLLTKECHRKIQLLCVFLQHLKVNVLKFVCRTVSKSKDARLILNMFQFFTHWYQRTLNRWGVESLLCWHTDWQYRDIDWMTNYQQASYIEFHTFLPKASNNYWL